MSVDFVRGRPPAIMAVLALLALAAAIPAGPAQAAPSGPGEQEARAPAWPEEGDLALAGEAGRTLVGLAARPGEQGDNTLLVHLEPPGGPEDAGELEARLSVDGGEVPLEHCGPQCRTAEFALEGGERTEVTVNGDQGGTARIDLPQLPARGGQEALTRATQRMNALATYQVDERFGPADPPLRSTYAYQAPDRMRLETADGQLMVRIGRRVYSYRDGEWDVRSGPRLDVPVHIWDYPGPEAVRLVGEDEIDGLPTQVIAFFVEVGDLPVWYRLWLDEEDLVRAAEMRTRAHFMDHRYHSLDEPIAIDAPVGPGAVIASELLGEGSRAWWDAGSAAARWLGYVGVLAAAGGVGFLAVVHDRRPDERIRLARLVAVVTTGTVLLTLLAFPVQIAAGAAAPVAALADPAAWGGTLSSPTGLAALLRIVGLLLLLSALPRLWSRGAVTLGLVGGTLAVGSLLPTGHAAAADPRFLALASQGAHVGAAAVWFGGLVMLTATLRIRRRADDGRRGSATVVGRFSSLALVSVAIVAVSGTANAWVLGESPRALAGNPYGWVLAVKAGLAAGVIGVAAYNRLRLVPALRRGDDTAVPRLRRTVWLEVAGLVGVAALTAVLTGVAPPTP